MAKTNYKGNFSKEELQALESDRLEALEELQGRKDKDAKRRRARGNRHTDWSEEAEH